MSSTSIAHLHISRITEVNTTSLNQYLTYNIKQSTFFPILIAVSNYTNMITALCLTPYAHGTWKFKTHEYELQTEHCKK